MSSPAKSTHSSSPSEEGLNKIRKTIERVILGFTAIVVTLVLTMLLFAWHPWTEWGGGNTTNPPQDRVVASTACSGHIQSIRLTNASATNINPTGQCSFTFEVAEGTARFGNEVGEVAVWSADQAAGGKMPGIVTKAEAVTETALLNYMLCPIGHRVEGWQCL